MYLAGKDLDGAILIVDIIVIGNVISALIRNQKRKYVVFIGVIRYCCEADVFVCYTYMRADKLVTFCFVTTLEHLVLPGEHRVRLRIVNEAATVGYDVNCAAVYFNSTVFVVYIVVFSDVLITFV